MSGLHAHPFRFIDRVVEVAGGRAAVKAASAGELPQPATDLEHAGDLPAALVFEALAQAAVPLAEDGPTPGAGPDRSPGQGLPGMIVAIHGARLLREVRAGDVLRIRAEMTDRLGDLIRVRSRGEVDGACVAEGDFTVALGAAAAVAGDDAAGGRPRTDGS